MCSGTKTAIN